jgi:hypothetical protein
MARAQDRPKSDLSQFDRRRRLCLLKGCGCWFRPKSPLSRYCSADCQEKVRQWSKRRAAERYRQTEKGKAARRKQATARRRRRKEQRTEFRGSPPSVGDHNECHQGFICARPGCYERVIPTDRSPLKKYCSHECYMAMRRVLERERRWHERVREHRRRGEGIEKRFASRIGHSKRRKL